MASGCGWSSPSKGDPWAYASASADRVCGNSGADHLYAGDDADLTFGGSGDDQVYGDASDDRAYGNDGSDTVYGGTGTDRLQGNAGPDWLDGGTEADVLLGGTSRDALADGADVLLGGGGPDILVGDNAQSDEPAEQPADQPYPTDLGSSDATLGGADLLRGGDDHDAVLGGLGDDTAYGGNGDDGLEGNPDSDTVSGELGDDDLVGGSSQLASGSFTGSEPGRPDGADRLDGGAGEDVIAGDNARLARTGASHPLMTGRGITTTRGVDLADESSLCPAGVFGNDVIRGGDATDVLFGQRGDDDVSLGEGADYGEGGPGVDSVNGDAGDDDVVGGSFTPVSTGTSGPGGQPDAHDALAGDAGQDVVLGDNASVLRPGPTGPQLHPLTADRVQAQRLVTPYDLGGAPVPGTSGPDTVTGGTENDVLLGQGGADSTDGGSESDYVEGGHGSDLVLGGTGDDDVTGGSFATSTTSAGEVGQPDGADNVLGGSGSDLVLGDNGLLTRVSIGRDWRTVRADATQTGLVPGRGVALHDLGGPVPATADASRAGADALSGQEGVDVILGQDGDDAISGGGHDDYVEGDGGADVLHGDLALVASELVVAPASSAWGRPAVDGSSVTPGQDDLTGGSARQGHRDGGDTIDGDAGDDFVVGDNGSIARVVDDGTTDRAYTQRYGALRTGQAKVRVAGGGASSTRFCPTTGASATATCEAAGAFGADLVRGGSGQDVLYGQDGNDSIWGGADDDDLYGELGADVLSGEDGEDAILGDRGGVQNRYETGSRSTTTTLSMPPALTLVTRRDGSVSREADLLHDVNGTDLVGGATSARMPLDGISFGGADRLRGGAGRDSLHAGAGDDLANGDAGGDAVFGGRGEDVLWGGAGRVCASTDAACLADPGASGEFVDHLAGGRDGDVIDWRPRGAYGTGPGLTGRTCTTGTEPVTTGKDGTTDPCAWFEMTDRANDDASAPATLSDNQHHQGVDWVYGGWDRDVMQGDLSQNGPHPGDRLMDWSGVYNLYSHCNSAYGGFTDVRNHAPSVQAFLLAWATGNGAGRPAAGGAPADVATVGTSAHDELALVYTSDNKDHGTGKPYPTSPGHFDDNACSGP